MSCKVSIIITAHNYAKYLPKALDSALNQTYEDFEVIVVNDSSTDDTEAVLASYAGRSRLKVVTAPGVGLAAASNRGIEASSGECIVRLDADDWFDENLALVEATYLDKNPNVGLVFCDYYTVDAHGEIIDRVRRAKLNDEVELLDRPALAAGAMYRRRCYEAIGGYNEALPYQEDYDFWIKFIEKFQVRNVSLPLMYYRQHGNNMSRNWAARMATRRQVKEKFVREHRDRFQQTVLAMVPARRDHLDGRKLPLLPLGEKSVLERCIKKLLRVEMIDRVIVSTDDPEIAIAAEEAGAEMPYLRGKASTSPSVLFESVLLELLRWLHDNESYDPDIVVICYPHSPFIRSEHITEAIDTLLLYDTDSVIGVIEDLTYHWGAGRTGLMPVGYQKRVVRQDKDLIYKEAGGIYVIKAVPFLAGGELLGKSIGHIELAPHEAVRIQTPYDYWVACRMLEAGEKWLKS